MNVLQWSFGGEGYEALIIAVKIVSSERYPSLMHKYESDLTGKEKRQLQWKTFKELPLKDKPGHLWAYHKLLLAIPFILIFLGFSINGIIQNVRTETVLNVAVTDTPGVNQTEVANETEKLLNLENPFSEVLFDYNFFSYEGMFDHNSIQKFAVIISAQGMDVLITNKDIYRRYYEHGTFMDLNYVFSQEELMAVNLIDSHAIDITNYTNTKEMLGITYEPVYFMVISNVELDHINTEGITKRETIRQFFYRVIQGIPE